MKSKKRPQIETPPQAEPAPGTICAADGTQPFNGFLWPTESWWLGHEHRHMPCRWNFGYVALADGRFAVSGQVWEIREDREDGKKNCFPTREAAIRAAAARLIIVMRGSRSWENSWDRLVGKRLAFAINWTLATVAREIKAGPPREVTIKEPEPPKKLTGLPLFDYAPSNRR